MQSPGSLLGYRRKLSVRVTQHEKDSACPACFEDGRRRVGPVEGGNGKEAGCHCTVKERTVDQTSDLWSHKILTRLFMLPNL